MSQFVPNSPCQEPRNLAFLLTTFEPNLKALRARIICVFFLACIPLRGQTIVNGSFESPPGASITTFVNGSSIGGWLVTGKVQLIGSYWQAAQGTQSLCLGDGGTFGSVSQQIATVPGTIYRIKFEYSGNPDGGGGILDQVSITWNGAVLGTNYFMTSDSSHLNMDWQWCVFDVVASNTTSTLGFTNTSAAIGGIYAPVIDNVSLTAIPQPSSPVLSISDKIGLGTNGLYQWSGNGHYYEPIATGTNITWITASNAAAAAGGHLAIITNAIQNAFLYNLIATNTAMWVPAPGGPFGPFLGGFLPVGAADPAGWAWCNGNLFTYTNWRPGEPNNLGGDENCLMMIGNGTNTTAYWNDIPNDGPPGYGITSYIVEYNQVPQAVQITWQSLLDYQYQVQWASSLSSNSWSNLGPAILGTGEYITTLASRTGSGASFYRVGVFP